MKQKIIEIEYEDLEDKIKEMEDKGFKFLSIIGTITIPARTGCGLYNDPEKSMSKIIFEKL